MLNNAPWLFALLVLPYGFTSTAVTVILMPYLLRKYGMPVDRISVVTAIALVPAIWAFLWSPLADAGMRKRSWVVISALGAALAAAGAVLDVHGTVTSLTALLFLSNSFVGLLSSACGALLTVMPEALRGRSAGWYQAGNLGGGAIGGGLVIKLADHASLPIIALAIAAAMVLPTLAAFLIEEPVPVRRAIAPQLVSMFHDMREVLSSRRTWLGLVFFLSPVGSMGISNLISSVNPDYHASGNTVAWVAGFGSGLFSIGGCIFGGFLADRMNRMRAYALSGVLAATFGAYLALGPATPSTYAIGYSAYSVASGIAFAVYTALLLDVLGRRTHAAATAYSTLNAAGNVPISYMTWLDGVGYKHWGARGLMATDAVANGGFAIVLLLVAAFAGHHWHHRKTESAAPVEA